VLSLVEDWTIETDQEEADKVLRKEASPKVQP